MMLTYITQPSRGSNCLEPVVYLCMLYQNKHVIHFPCLCRTVKQFPGQSKANNSQNGSRMQVNVQGTFMSHVFEVCWETRSSHYISMWVLCLVGTVTAKSYYFNRKMINNLLEFFNSAVSTIVWNKGVSTFMYHGLIFMTTGFFCF